MQRRYQILEAYARDLEGDLKVQEEQKLAIIESYERRLSEAKASLIQCSTQSTEEDLPQSKQTDEK